MQPANFVINSDKEIFLIVDPLLAYHSAHFVPYQSLIKCRYCHSLNPPFVKSNKFQCRICKCFNQIPTDYSSLLPIVNFNFILTQPPSLINCISERPQVKGSIQKIMKKDSQSFSKQDRLRLLFIVQSKLGSAYNQALQCLTDILPQYRNLDIALITFEKNIKIVELEDEGRIFSVNSESIELLNEKFVPVSEQSLTQLFAVLNQPVTNSTTVNPTKVINQILPKLQNRPTVVIWLSSLGESMQYYSYNQYPNIEVYAILKIPNIISTYNQMKNLEDLNKHSKRVKYITNNQKEQQVIQKIHYQLYEILWNTIKEIKVEGSRQRKYSPEIITKKERLLGSLRNCVIAKLGKNIEMKESFQIRIRYKQTLNAPQLYAEEEKEGEQKSRDRKNVQNKLLIITCVAPDQWSQNSLNLCRYLQLYRLIKQNLTNLQLRNLEIKNQIDIQIAQFLRESSYLQKVELEVNIENLNCIYVVWPWIAMKSQEEVDEKRKVKLIYYFTGHYFLEPSQSKNKKIEQSLSNISQLLGQEIKQLNDLCQILYSHRDSRLPNYYQNILHEIQLPENLSGSDSDREEEVGEKLEAPRYYLHRIK